MPKGTASRSSCDHRKQDTPRSMHGRVAFVSRTHVITTGRPLWKASTCVLCKKQRWGRRKLPRRLEALRDMPQSPLRVQVY